MANNAPPRGVIILDVDGVLNLMTFAKPTKFYESVKVGPYKIIYHPDIIKRLNEIQRRKEANIYWLTTWGSKAVTDLAPAIGLRKFKVLAEPPEDIDGLTARDHDWWKLKAVQELYKRRSNQQRFTWIDDELSLEKVARGWCVGKRIHTISPVPHQGVGLGDINNSIVYFASQRLK